MNVSVQTEYAGKSSSSVRVKTPLRSKYRATLTANKSSETTIDSPMHVTRNPLSRYLSLTSQAKSPAKLLLFGEDKEDLETARKLRKVEEGNGKYKIMQKLDSGTFADIYKGEKIVQDGDPPPKHKYVAIKRLHCISSRRRMSEMKIMWNLGGKAHIAKLIGVYRHFSTLYMVMPYFDVINFTEYYNRMTIEEIKEYMKALLSGLARLAEYGWVHRDVKPCNFLHRPANWKNTGGPARYMLIDFGLAQKESELIAKAKVQERRLKQMYKSGKKVKRLGSLDVDYNSAPPENYKDYFWVSSSKDKRTKQSGFRKEALINGALPVPERSGTRGFRAPEVLCRTWHQGCALDVWSAGIILLSLLTRIFPFFQSPNDVTALAEIVHIVGRRPLQLAANRINRCFKIRKSDTSSERGMSFSTLAKLVLSKHKKDDSIENGNWKCTFSPELICSKADKKWPKEAWDLLDRMLTVDQMDRITAKEALKLPFFANKKPVVLKRQSLYASS
jgi:cell division control protein 7